MVIRKLQFGLIVLMVFSSFVGIAQKTLDKADMQFDLKAYDLAISNYEKVIMDDPNCLSCKFKIAESYRMMNKDQEALSWYSQIENTFSDPSFYLNYGILLKEAHNLDKARKYFNLYKATDPLMADHYLSSCDYMQENLNQPDHYALQNLELNSASSDFAPFPYKSRIVYASFYNKDAPQSTAYNTKLYSYDEKKSKKEVFQNNITADENISSISFDSSSKKCAYTKHNFQNGNSQVYEKESDLGIFLAEVDKRGNFKREVPFEHNAIGYSTTFPMLTKDGNTLFFSSNREGGFGGFDLYVSHKENGHWSMPINLGNEINTTGNEITPFIDGLDLYFSSDFHFGLGGFDIFKSTLENGQWNPVNNVGKGVNSAQDDMYPVWDKSRSRYYFTSNRSGGSGNHDIYIATATVDQELAYIMQNKTTIPEVIPITTNSSLSIPVEEVAQSNKSIITLSKPMPQEVAVVETKVSTPAVPVVQAQPEVATSTEVMPPAAVNLDDLIVKTDDDKAKNENILTVADRSEESIARKSRLDLALEGVRQISKGEILNDNNGEKVYFIQLAALYSTSGDIDEYSSLAEFGNIYRVYSSSSTKIKLGYFFDKYQVDNILSKVKSKGFQDAFITQEILNTSNLELAISEYGSNSYSSTETYPPTSTYTAPSTTSSTTYSSGTTTGNVYDTNANTSSGSYYSESNTTTSGATTNFDNTSTTTSTYTPTHTSADYKVRLASYEDPIWFDLNKVKDLGVIEQWSKSRWTIFVMSGFNSYDEAESARIKAYNRGFRDAAVVIDRGGILETMENH